jgi:hypothetical protein
VERLVTSELSSWAAQWRTGKLLTAAKKRERECTRWFLRRRRSGWPRGAVSAAGVSGGGRAGEPVVIDGTRAWGVCETGEIGTWASPGEKEKKEFSN